MDGTFSTVLNLPNHGRERVLVDGVAGDYGINFDEYVWDSWYDVGAGWGISEIEVGKVAGELVPAREAGLWGYIDGRGKEVIPFEFTEVFVRLGGTPIHYQGRVLPGDSPLSGPIRKLTGDKRKVYEWVYDADGRLIWASTRVPYFFVTMVILFAGSWICWRRFRKWRKTVRR